MCKTVEKTRVGLNYLSKGKVKAALRKFEEAVRTGDGSNLERDVAALFMVNAARYRREWKKRRLYKNAHIMDFNDWNSWNAWSDVDIAAVLMSPDNPTVNRYLEKFLGRTPEAIRFQRRYASGQPLESWKREDGKRYTRFTQTNFVKNKLSV